MISPYLAPGFYDTALAKGRHREIVGGRWDETGRIQMQALRAEGLGAHHRLLDIGAGALRLGCKAVPYLHPGNYFATDASLALMKRGRDLELPDPAALPDDHLIEDADFAFPRIPPVDYAIAFGVFTHLPRTSLALALTNLRLRQPRLHVFLFTVFLAPDPTLSHRQNDGVVTHADRPPYHLSLPDLLAIAKATGWAILHRDTVLPRGQALFVGRPG